MQNPHLPALLQTDHPEGWYGVKGHVFSLLQFVYTASSAFLTHQGPLRAAALTYTTVLSLVPFLAIAFSVLKGLGAQNSLEPLLRQFAGDSQETISRLIAYVNNTNVKSLGAIGLVMLIVTVVSLMGSVDEAFNNVWGVRETRSLQRRFSDYLSVIIVGPVLLLAATSMTSSLQSQWLLQWLIEHTWLGDAILQMFRILPYLSVWVAMIFLYSFIPNTRVRFASAVVGGVVAGTAWQVAQWGYFYFQVGVANYNAIYGTLSAVPIFLVWIYTSWLIVLFGLEIVCAHQHRGHGVLASGAFRVTATLREELAVALLVQVSLHFHSGGAPASPQLLADELAVPLLLLEPMCDELEQKGFLVVTSGDSHGLLPARDPSETLITTVLEAVRGDSALPPATPVLQLAGDVVRQGWLGSLTTLDGVTLRDLLKQAVE